MTTFNDREKAAENKYAHDQERQFKVKARRTKLMGLWAARRMNLSGAAADDYAKSLIAATISSNDDEDIVAQVKADLSGRGITATEKEIKEELFKVTQIAKEQIEKEA